MFQLFNKIKIFVTKNRIFYKKDEVSLVEYLLVSLIAGTVFYLIMKMMIIEQINISAITKMHTNLSTTNARSFVYGIVNAKFFWNMIEGPENYDLRKMNLILQELDYLLSKKTNIIFDNCVNNPYSEYMGNSFYSKLWVNLCLEQSISRLFWLFFGEFYRYGIVCPKSFFFFCISLLVITIWAVVQKYKKGSRNYKIMISLTTLLTGFPIVYEAYYAYINRFGPAIQQAWVNSGRNTLITLESVINEMVETVLTAGIFSDLKLSAQNGMLNQTVNERIIDFMTKVTQSRCDINHFKAGLYGYFSVYCDNSNSVNFDRKLLSNDDFVNLRLLLDKHDFKKTANFQHFYIKANNLTTFDIRDSDTFKPVSQGKLNTEWYEGSLTYKGEIHNRCPMFNDVWNKWLHYKKLSIGPQRMPIFDSIIDKRDAMYNMIGDWRRYNFENNYGNEFDDFKRFYCLESWRNMQKKSELSVVWKDLVDKKEMDFVSKKFNYMTEEDFDHIQMLYEHSVIIGYSDLKDITDVDKNLNKEIFKNYFEKKVEEYSSIKNNKLGSELLEILDQDVAVSFDVCLIEKGDYKDGEFVENLVTEENRLTNITPVEGNWTENNKIIEIPSEEKVTPVSDYEECFNSVKRLSKWLKNRTSLNESATTSKKLIDYNDHNEIQSVEKYLEFSSLYEAQKEKLFLENPVIKAYFVEYCDVGQLRPYFEQYVDDFISEKLNNILADKENSECWKLEKPTPKIPTSVFINDFQNGLTILEYSLKDLISKIKLFGGKGGGLYLEFYELLPKNLSSGEVTLGVFFIPFVVGAYIYAYTPIIGVLASIPKIFSFKVFSVEKLSSYECGFAPFSLKSVANEAHYTVVGIIFLIFDLEIVYLVPFLVSAAMTNMARCALFSYYLIISITVGIELSSGAISWPIWMHLKRSKDPIRDLIWNNKIKSFF